MTPKQEAALRQAREALANSLDSVANAYYNDWRHGIPTRKAQLDGLKQDLEKHESALAAIDEALAEQPAQQEPVDLEAVYETIIRWDIGGGKRSRRELARSIVDLYTSPQPSKQWVGLTEAEREEATDSGWFVEEIEAKLREKNTGETK